MAGSRLSGFTLVPLERHLKTVEIGWRFGFEQTIKRPAVPQVGADQSGKGERAIERGLCRLGETEQWKRDQCDGDLDARGIFGGAEKAANLKVCLTQRKNNSIAQRPL